MHPNAPSYVDKSIDQVYTAFEKEKKKAYNERVIQMEKGTSNPIVMSTSGGVGNEADRHHKRITPLIAEKRRKVAEKQLHLCLRNVQEQWLGKLI